MHLKLVEPKKKSNRKSKTVVATHEEIAAIAKKLYEERGGDDLANWLEAEAIAKSKKN